jgi:hypothetical protein
MELMLRPPKVRYHPLRPRLLSGLGAGTCQWPQPGVEMVYPACSPTLDSDLRAAPTSQYSSVYDVPGLLLPYENCQTAMGIPDAACVERNLITEHLNFQRTADYHEQPTSGASIAPVWNINGQLVQSGAAPAPTSPTSAPAPAPAPASSGGSATQSGGGSAAAGGGTASGQQSGSAAAGFDPTTLLLIGGAIVALYLATRS